MADIAELEALGWSPRWEALFADHAAAGFAPGRVLRTDRGSALVALASGLARAEPSHRLLKSAKGPDELPVTGDWVAVNGSGDVDVPQVEAVLGRSSAFTRGDPGKTSAAQVIAANIDVVFVVHPIAEPPNLRRIERELALAWESGATPVVVLTKADLSEDPEAARASAEAVSIGVDVRLTSAADPGTVMPLLGYGEGHRTIALIGPSGAGKSTLVNVLVGEERQATREVRASDGKGRHTTVTRELVPMPGGGLLLDTPGMRAIALTDAEGGIAAAFPDIEGFAEACRFRDCSHTGEPGCAVEAAVSAGELPEERLASYRKLRRESEVAAMRTDARLRAEEVRKWKVAHKSLQEHYKRFGGKKL